MRVVVLGSGVVGIASAYYLAQLGHEVVVVDRQETAGMETSFANAGQVSPGYSAPWAGPGVPIKAMKWLLMKHSPLVIRPQADLHQWRWMAQMLANCTEKAYSRNKGRMVRLAEYSRDCMQALRQEVEIHYDHRERGLVQLFRRQEQLDAIGGDLAVLDAYKVGYEVLDVAGCIAAEPALGLVREKVVGGLRLTGDETGDAFMFSQRLAEIAAGMGVSYRYDTTIRQLVTEGDRITGVVVNGGEVIKGDAFVAALGSYTPALLSPLGIKLPIYPVKGYSLTMPIIDPDGAPVSTVMDETYKIGITRLGDRIRVGGTAELAGFNLDLREPRRATLAHSVMDLFPKGGDARQASFWTGLRPMTPDGTPIVGGTKFANLFTNTGHGTLGWTMACGSGKLIADIISGQKPDIAHDDLAADRYDREWF